MTEQKTTEFYDRDEQVYLGNSAYSKFVKIMMFVLPLLALSIIIVLVLKLSIKEQMPNLTIAETTRNPEGEIEMIGVSYEGMDQEKRPYRVDAEKASRSSINPEDINLEKPIANIKLNDNIDLNASADKGVYKRENSTVQLIGNVKLKHSGGYNLTMDEILINMPAKNAISNSKVIGVGPEGNIESNGLTVAKNGNRIIFIGPSKITILNKKDKIID